MSGDKMSGERLQFTGSQEQLGTAAIPISGKVLPAGPRELFGGIGHVEHHGDSTEVHEYARSSEVGRPVGFTLVAQAVEFKNATRPREYTDAELNQY